MSKQAGVRNPAAQAAACYSSSAGQALGAPGQPEAHLVAQARPLPGLPGLTALTVVAGHRPPSTVIADIPDPARLLRAGRWIAPMQAGDGPWWSPWLELSRPTGLMDVVHVDESP